MKNKLVPFTVFVASIVFTACANTSSHKVKTSTTSGTGKEELPPPFATKSARNFSKVVGWPAGKTPVAPKGFTVTKFADRLDHPRWIYPGENGDIFIAESNTKGTLGKNRVFTVPASGVAKEAIPSLFRD